MVELRDTRPTIARAQAAVRAMDRTKLSKRARKMRRTAVSGFALLALVHPAAARTMLVNDLLLRVSNSGSDANDCLTPATACQHIQFVTLKAENEYDGQGHSITISIADGTYTENVHQTNPLVGTLTLYYLGNTVHPENVIVDANNTNPTFYASKFSNLGMSGLTLQNSGGGDALYIGEGTVMHIDAGMNYGPTTGGCHKHVDYNALIYIAGGYSISAGAAAEDCYSNNGVISDAGITINIPNNIAIGNFVNGQTGGIGTVYGNTYTGFGTVTGYKYNIILNAVLNAGGHPELIPGTNTIAPSLGGQVF